MLRGLSFLRVRAFVGFFYVVVLVEVLSGHLHFSCFCCFSCTDESVVCFALLCRLMARVKKTTRPVEGFDVANSGSDVVLSF